MNRARTAALALVLGLGLATAGPGLIDTTVDTLAPPAVAAAIPDVEPEAAAAVHICNSYKSATTLRVWNRGSRATQYLRPGHCASDALGELTYLIIPTGYHGRSGTTCDTGLRNLPRLAAQTWNLQRGGC